MYLVKLGSLAQNQDFILAKGFNKSSNTAWRFAVVVMPELGGVIVEVDTDITRHARRCDNLPACP